MEKFRNGAAESIISIAVNTLLSALKLWAGLAAGSVALIADAWYTFSESITQVITAVTIRGPGEKADREHHSRYRRWEQIGSIIVSVFIAFLAFDFAKISVVGLLGGKNAVFGAAAITVTIISIVVKELLAQYAFYTAKLTGNKSFKNTGLRYRTGALTSTVILAGILFAKRFWWTDSVLGLIIALVMAWTAFLILRMSILKIMGIKPPQELIDNITKEIVNLYEDDFQIHHWIIYNYDPHKELIVHIKLNQDLSIQNSHEIITGIQKLILDKFGIITVIRVEPMDFRQSVSKFSGSSGII
ncbi:MAG: cation diffusion facilitator family transporter [Treponema sp.]|nr:cation diffusion facilitator family transporter [Treponema sp.]